MVFDLNFQEENVVRALGGFTEPGILCQLEASDNNDIEVVSKFFGENENTIFCNLDSALVQEVLSIYVDH